MNYYTTTAYTAIRYIEEEKDIKILEGISETIEKRIKQLKK